MLDTKVSFSMGNEIVSFGLREIVPERDLVSGGSLILFPGKFAKTV